MFVILLFNSVDNTLPGYSLQEVQPKAKQWKYKVATKVWCLASSDLREIPLYEMWREVVKSKYIYLNTVFKYSLDVLAFLLFHCLWLYTSSQTFHREMFYL